MTRPFFTRERISHFETFETYTDEAIALMSKRLDEGFAVDVQDVFARFTLDVATETLFGSCVHSLGDALLYPSNSSRSASMKLRPSLAAEFSRAFAEAQSVISKRVHMGSLWRLFEIFHDKTTEPMAVCDAYLEPFVVEALRKKALAAATSSSKADEINDNDTLLDHLVKLTDGNVPVKHNTKPDFSIVIGQIGRLSKTKYSISWLLVATL